MVRKLQVESTKVDHATDCEIRGTDSRIFRKNGSTEMPILKVYLVSLYFCSVYSIYHNKQTNKAVKVWFNDVKVVRSNFLFDDEMSHQSESVVTSPLLQS